MIRQTITTIIFITSFSFAVNDTVGDRERPPIYVTCEDQMKILDKAGCLLYNKQTSPHCLKITAPDDEPISNRVDTSRCRPGGFELYYSCSEFAVCVHNNTEKSGGEIKKKTAPPSYR